MSETPAVEQNSAELDARIEQISQDKALELQQLVADQLSAASPDAAVTVTEYLADDQGALGQKVQELGLTEQWQEFKNAQAPIAGLREQLMALDAEAQAAAAKQQEAQHAAPQAKGGKINFTGALVGAVLASHLGKKRVESNPLRVVIATVGAFLGAALASAIGARRNKAAEPDAQVPLEEQAAREQKAMELQQQIGLAQQQSMEGLVDAVVERMTGDELATQQTAEQAVEQPEENLFVPQEKAPAQPEAPQAEHFTSEPAQPQLATQPEAEAEKSTDSLDETLARLLEDKGLMDEVEAAAAPFKPEVQAAEPAPEQQEAPSESLESALGAIFAEQQAQPKGNYQDSIARERAEQQESSVQR